MRVCVGGVRIWLSSRRIVCSLSRSWGLWTEPSHNSGTCLPSSLRPQKLPNTGHSWLALVKLITFWLTRTALCKGSEDGIGWLEGDVIFQRLPYLYRLGPWLPAEVGRLSGLGSFLSTTTQSFTCLEFSRWLGVELSGLTGTRTVLWKPIWAFTSSPTSQHAWQPSKDISSTKPDTHPF